MFLWWIALTILCAALLFVIVAMGTVLFSPVIFTLDSQNREFRLRWLAFVEFWAPLPGGAGAPALRIAGIPLRLPMRKRVPKHENPISGKVSSRPPVGFLWRCLRNPRIRRGVAKQLAKLLRRIAGAFKVTELQSRLSVPDPAINGMLAGALAQTGWGRNGRLRVNFTGENSLRCEVRLYPFRIANAGLLFVSRLPYMALMRAWRAWHSRRKLIRRNHEPGAEHT